MAMVTLALAVLVRTDGFCRRGAAVLFAVAAVAAMLTKVQGLFFLIGPVAFVAIRALMRQPADRGRILRNLGLTAAMGAALLTFFYAPLAGRAIEVFLRHTGQAGMAGSTGTTPLFSLGRLLFYPANLLFAISPVLVIPAVVGLVRRGRDGLLVTAAVVPIVILTVVVTTQWGRFILPILPVLAIAAADALLRLRSARARWGFTTCAVAAGMVQLVVTSFIIDLYRPASNWLNRASISISRRMPRPPRSDNMGEQIGRFVRYLDQRYPSAAPVKIGIIEEIELGREPTALLEYLTRVELPGHRIQFITSAGSPHHVFGHQRRFQLFVVVSRAPRQDVGETITEVMRRYRPMRTFWPKPYDYHGEPVRALATEIGAWPVAMRLRLLPGDYTMIVLRRPRSGGPVAPSWPLGRAWARP